MDNHEHIESADIIPCHKPRNKNFQDLTGQRFGKLIAKSVARIGNQRHTFWRCQCDCGKYIDADIASLRRLHTKSCGCIQKRNIDLIGRRFGNLLVEKRLGRERTSIMWHCKCDCGGFKKVSTTELMRPVKNIKSCGCLHRAAAVRNGKLNTIGDGVAAFNILFASYRNHAKARGLLFDLSLEKFRTLSKGDCYYCGDAPAGCQKTKCDTGVYIYNGVDRVDSSRGYEDDNCVSCCKICNIAKRDLPIEAFTEWIDRVYKNMAAKTDDVRFSAMA